MNIVITMAICQFLSASILLASIGNHLESQGSLQEDPKLDVHRLAAPGKAWALEVALPPGFSSVKQFETEDGFYLQDSIAGWSVLASLKKAFSDGDAKSAREYFTRKKNMGGLQIEDIKQYELNEAAIREYIIRDSRFRDLNGDVVVTKHLNYYLSHDGYWVEVSISKLNYEPSDQKFLDEILTNIRIVPLPTPVGAVTPPFGG